MLGNRALRTAANITRLVIQSGVKNKSTSRVTMCSNLLFVCVLCHWGTVQEVHHILNNNVPHSFNTTAIETGDFCCQRNCSKTKTSCRDKNAARETTRHISSAPPFNHPLDELHEMPDWMYTPEMLTYFLCYCRGVVDWSLSLQGTMQSATFRLVQKHES